MSFNHGVEGSSPSALTKNSQFWDSLIVRSRENFVSSQLNLCEGLVTHASEIRNRRRF